MNFTVFSVSPHMYLGTVNRAKAAARNPRALTSSISAWAIRIFRAPAHVIEKLERIHR